MLSELTRTSRSMGDQHELEERVKTALAECERLREENVRLRAMLSIHDPVLEHPDPSAPGSAPTPLPCRSITEASTPEQKIALFRGLFRGREDVYAVRWEGKGGKAGYSPAGVMDWQAIHVAEERKKVARKTRILLPLTDDAVRNHLTLGSRVRLGARGTQRLTYRTCQELRELTSSGTDS